MKIDKLDWNYKTKQKKLKDYLLLFMDQNLHQKANIYLVLSLLISNQISKI